MRRLLPILLLLSVSAHAQTFRPEAIRAHMELLASDLLEGRGTATRGYRIAAEYVAAQLAAYGLESSFQNVPFRTTIAQDTSTVTLTRDGAEPIVLRYADGFITSGDPLHAEHVIEGEVVYAGFGVSAPEQNYDDYAGVDVRRKIVAVFTGAPKSFPNAVRAHHSSSLQKIETAVARGAIGLIVLHTPRDFARFPWVRSVRQSRLGAMHWLRADGTPASVFPALSSTVTVSEKAMEALFAGAPTPLASVIEMIESRTAKPFALPTRARIRIVSKHDRVESPNVVGLLRGSDPVLRDEHLVYSSHLDHLGISEPLNGDAINNGALDNASGIAALLEIARNLAALQPRPKRSIVFLFTTGEEKGLRGADYFAHNPSVAGPLVANINIDQILMMRRTRDMIALGAETNDLGDAAKRVARAMRLELSPEPFPDEVYFVRSDQYPFVKRGIPAIYVGIGYKAREPGVDAEKEQSEWIGTRYHTPRDDMSQRLDYRVATDLAEFNYRMGLDVANAPKRPRWKPGDFFGEKFGK